MRNPTRSILDFLCAFEFASIRASVTRSSALCVIPLLGVLFLLCTMSLAMGPEDNGHWYHNRHNDSLGDCTTEGVDRPMYQFSCKDVSESGTYTILMADPTIMALEDPDSDDSWYFVTGSSVDYGATNFPIFKSRDLINWEFHGLAFPPVNFNKIADSPGYHPFPRNAPDYCIEPAYKNPDWIEYKCWHCEDGSDINILSDELGPLVFDIYGSNNPRVFSNFGAPHLYVDPVDRGGTERYVYLTFSVAEERDGWGDRDWHQREGTQLAMIPVSAFLDEKFGRGSSWGDPNRGPFFCDPDIFPGAPGPYWYYYRENNGGVGTDRLYDGGWTQWWNNGQQGAIREHMIPTTVYPEAEGPVDGEAEELPRGWRIRGIGPEVVIHANPYVFFDPLDGYAPWICFSFGHMLSNQDEDSMTGNNIAAYPLRTDGEAYLLRELDALPQSGKGLIPLFYRWNSTTSFAVDESGECLPNGGVKKIPGGGPDYAQGYWQDAWGNPEHVSKPMGNVEGLSVLHWNDAYYLFASRNVWNSPGYQIVYRKVDIGANQSFKDTTLGVWDGVAGTSWKRQDASEKIWVASNYVEKYTSDPKGQCPSDEQDGANNGYFGHGQVFFYKDKPYMIFHGKRNQTQEFRRIFIKEIRFDGNGDLVRVWDGAGGTWDESLWHYWLPCRVDYNMDGTVDSGDFVIFLNKFSNSDPDADFNGDGVVNSSDLTAFLNEYVERNCYEDYHVVE